MSSDEFDPIDPGGEDPIGDDPVDPYGDDSGGSGGGTSGGGDSGGGGSTEESYFIEESFEGSEYYGSSNPPPSYVPPSAIVPSPIGKTQAATYRSTLKQNQTCTIVFTGSSSGTITPNIHGFVTLKKSSCSGQLPRIAHKATLNTVATGSFQRAAFRTTFNTTGFTMTDQEDEFGSTDNIPYNFALRIVQNNQVVASQSIRPNDTWGGDGYTYPEDTTFLEMLPLVFLSGSTYSLQLYVWAAQSNAHHFNYSLENGTFYLWVKWSLIDSFPYAEPPTITLSNDTQAIVGSGALSPSTVTFTLNGGYQLGRSVRGYELQRRSTLDGSTFSAWTTVGLQGTTTSRNSQGARVTAYTAKDAQFGNWYEEVLFQETLKLSGNLADASPSTIGSYYQYRARSLLATGTSWSDDWVCQLITLSSGATTTLGFSTTGDMTDTNIINPWSATVQCQRIFTIASPSNIRVSPERGRKSVILSWTVPDVSKLVNVYQDTIDYYIKAQYTDSDDTVKTLVVYKVTFPASRTGRVSVEFTDDPNRRNGILAKLPKCSPPKDIRFTVYAVYNDATSDFASWATFQWIKGGVYYFVNGAWKQCAIYYFSGGTWHECTPYYFSGGNWVECGA